MIMIEVMTAGAGEGRENNEERSNMLINEIKHYQALSRCLYNKFSTEFPP